MPEENHSKGKFEGEVTANLEWIKENLSKLQSLCADRGMRLSRCEADICTLHDIVEQQHEHETRIRDCEKGLTQTRTVGSIVLVAWGIASQWIGNLWSK